MTQASGGRGEAEDGSTRAILPCFKHTSLGGLGLFAAERIAAAWADLLLVLQQRQPDATARCWQEFAEGDGGVASCVRTAVAAGQGLDESGWNGRPWGAVGLAFRGHVLRLSAGHQTSDVGTLSWVCMLVHSCPPFQRMPPSRWMLCTWPCAAASGCQNSCIVSRIWDHTGLFWH